MVGPEVLIGKTITSVRVSTEENKIFFGTNEGEFCLDYFAPKAFVLNNVCKHPFNRDRLYPHCAASEELIKLMWDERRNRVRKTFSERELACIKKVGKLLNFEVKIIGDSRWKN